MITELASLVDPIVKTLTVGCDAAETFRFFTGNFGQWWPVHDPKYTGPNATAVEMEPRKGGRIFATYKDGHETQWGIITEFAPGARVSFSWSTPVSEDVTQVSVEFTEGDDGTCTVTLTHSGWEKLGDKAGDVRPDYDEGWDHVLEDCFVPGLRAAS